MNFSEALKAMKMGSKVSRELWRGHLQCVYRVGDLFVSVCSNGTELIKTEFATTDILAEDWWLVT